MDWNGEELGAYEREVLQVVLRFDAVRHEREFHLPPILGVGIVASQKEPHPLILLEAPVSVDAVPLDVRSGEDLEEALAMSAETLAAMGYDLDRPEYPSGVRYLLANRPEPFVSSGDPIRSISPPQGRGTVGLPVTRTDASGNTVEGFMTAGHCAPAGVGSTIEAIHTHGILPATHTKLGTVGLHREPVSSGGPEHDVAVVDNVSPGAAVTGPSTGVIARLSPVISSPFALDVHGGASGTVGAEIMGSFLDVEYSNSRLWKDCWLLVPSGVTAPGDSGAAAVDLNRDVVGTLVGGSRSTRKSRAPSFQYLQDMDSLEHGFLAPNNVTLV
jgi:hypothetical protein